MCLKNLVGHRENSAHCVLFITHVRGNWLRTSNEKVPCFCNLPDSMKVIKCMGK